MQFELRRFSLRQLDKLAGSAKDRCLAGPLADEKSKLLHRGPLNFNVRRTGYLCHNKRLLTGPLVCRHKIARTIASSDTSCAQKFPAMPTEPPKRRQLDGFPWK